MLAKARRHVRIRMGREQVLERRDFLRTVSAASLAAGTLAWSDLMSAQAEELRRRQMACILLWMQGGPSQFETFSPLPGHPNGGETKAISTSVPGIQIAENLPRMAQIMDRLAVIRSMTSAEGSHPRATYLLHTGNLPTPTVKYPGLGSIACEQISEPDCELPGFVQIGNRRLGGSGAGFLGGQYDPFLIRRGDELPQNTQPTTDVARFRRRLDLIERLETGYAAAGAAQQVAEHGKLYRKASRMILSSQMKAFDLDQETDQVRDAYGRTPFGSGCLLARRLVASGVTFVEVISDGWDTHADNFERTRRLAGEIDQPMAQLITDLDQRGMLDRTLVLWMGEFGRTPKINPNSGRDHYPRAFNVALAGGPIRGGQVVGETDEGGTTVRERPVTVPDLFRTICKALKIDPDHQYMTPIGRPIRIVEGGGAVDELFS